MKAYVCSFSLTNKGQARTQTMHLGELEKQVLQYLWRHEVADAKQVHASFKKHRSSSLNTIQSTLDRLYKKGLLLRDKQGHAYRYRAAIQRKVLIGQLIKEVVSDFTSADEDRLMTAFVSLSAELDEQHLEKLEQLIEDHRNKPSSDN